ncbi:MAG TPA: hypothetical protein VL181_09355 [Holophagaceae bacterium]|nr:hypothetical protein [Holophagaceae bacterium]
MNQVWTLHHVHEFDDGHEDVKLIGIFSSENLALAAKQKIQDQPGFLDLPDGFEIHAHKLDQLGWLEGYISILPGQE